MKVKVQVLNDEVDESMPKKARWLKHCGAIEYAYNNYYYKSHEYQRLATMYSILAEMAKNHKDELLRMWDEIRDTGILHFDEDDPLYLSMDICHQWFVYHDKYMIDKINYGEVHFEKQS